MLCEPADYHLMQQDSTLRHCLTIISNRWWLGGKSRQGRLGARLCVRQSSNISRWFRYMGMFTSREEWPDWVERRALILEANMGTAIYVLRW